MAKYIEHGTDSGRCQHCGTYFSFEQVYDEPSLMDRGTIQRVRNRIIPNCSCPYPIPRTNTTNLSISKEVPVAKVYDTTESKSVALNTIVSKVQQIERALYNRVHAIAKAEAEHNKHVADANNALDNVLAEAWQAGLEEEDLELHLPDYDEYLSERLVIVAQEMSLANVLEGV